MAYVSDETLAKSSGSLYLAPIGTGKPADTDLDVVATLAAAGWIHVGWLDEDGPQEEGFEGDNNKHYGWDATTAIRSITRITEPMVNVRLLQWNVENLSLYYPGATYDAPSRTLSVPEAGNPAEWELLYVVKDGARVLGRWIGKVTARGGDNIEFPGDGLSVIPVIFDVLTNGNVDELHAWIGVDVAAAS